MQHLLRRALPWVLALFIACCLVQVFLAGLGVFRDPASFITHREFSYLFGWLTLIVLVLALAGRQPRLVVGLSVLILVQFSLQSILVGLRETQPTVAALHPVNGFLLILVSTWAFRAARASARAGAPAPAREGTATTPAAGSAPVAAASAAASSAPIEPA